MKHLKYKIKVDGAKCLKHEHTFIISGWLNSVAKDTAFTFTCQHCLLTINKTEMETLRNMHDCDADEKYKAEKPV